MQQREQCHMILTWITDEELAKKILENSEVLSEEKLPTFVKLPDSLLDENVNITFIEEYCAGNTFIKLKQLVKEKSKRSAWKCGTCSKFLGKKQYIMWSMSTLVTLQLQQTEEKASWKLVLYKMCS